MYKCKRFFSTSKINLNLYDLSHFHKNFFLTSFFLIDIDVCCLHESCKQKTTANEVMSNVWILGCTEPYLCLHRSCNGWVNVEKNLEFSWKENEQSSPMWKQQRMPFPPGNVCHLLSPAPAVGSCLRQGAAFIYIYWL